MIWWFHVFLLGSIVSMIDVAISYLSISINEKCLDYWKFENHTSWYCYGWDTLVLEMKGSKRINYGNIYQVSAYHINQLKGQLCLSALSNTLSLSSCEWQTARRVVFAVPDYVVSAILSISYTFFYNIIWHLTHFEKQSIIKNISIDSFIR